PHPRLGQAIVAAYEGTASRTQVLAGLEHLPRWQVPKELRQVAELPLTGPGKVDRRAVRGLFTR
ncbi:MAG TPA: O-succinylbenzoic acid--CoA ligase, partial [Corynebacterium sp.]|nr:O-succinylbenzoic acid--CoA ligase [Corynebacterium sp.]